MTQVGQYIISNNSTSNLILHITKKLVSGESLFNLKQEEILIIQNVCTLMFSHGIQILLLRETLHNIGVSDLVVLNRKVPDEFWFNKDLDQKSLNISSVKKMQLRSRKNYIILELLNKS